MERKLAAILAVDVVGYSALMETDEAGTFDRLRRGRKELFEPEIAKRHGRIFKLMGDGLLAEFGSVVDAVECAVTLQRGMAERNASVAEDKRFDFRIGINLGEVIVEGDDRYGEGVNIAARLQQLAEPGGICVSEKVSREVEKKLAFRFEPMGEQQVNNIAEPIACYRVKLQLPRPAPTDRLPEAPAGMPSKAAIAVLPFANMSSDPEQEYFADGLAEDLITDLSKVAGLVVIARNSSFVYKGRHADVRSVGKDLGVRYVIEGSVRRSADRVRINAQLIDATDNTHIWADRFDRALADIFDLQDEIGARIVDALSAVLPSARMVRRQRPTNLEAYDLFVRGRVLAMMSREGNRTARSLLEKSVEIDPNFAGAQAWLAMTYHFGWLYWGEDENPLRSLARATAERALSLDPNDADALWILGYVHAYDGRLSDGIAEFEAALRLNPNHADAWALLADLMVFDGRPVDGIECARNAFRLNPSPPGVYYWALGWAEYAAGRYEDSLATLRHEASRGAGGQRLIAASLAMLGRTEEALKEARLYANAIPEFSVAHWAKTQPFRHAADCQHFVEGYLKAGLPE
jgi:TolB-like protein/class 3 adenylate cyclase